MYLRALFSSPPLSELSFVVRSFAISQLCSPFLSFQKHHHQKVVVVDDASMDEEEEKFERRKKNVAHKRGAQRLGHFEIWERNFIHRGFRKKNVKEESKIIFQNNVFQQQQGEGKKEMYKQQFSFLFRRHQFLVCFEKRRRKKTTIKIHLFFSRRFAKDKEQNIFLKKMKEGESE